MKWRVFLLYLKVCVISDRFLVLFQSKATDPHLD